MVLNLSIRYWPGYLNSINALSQKLDYEDIAKSIEKITWIKQKTINGITLLGFLILIYEIVLLKKVLFKNQEMRP